MSDTRRIPFFDACMPGQHSIDLDLFISVFHLDRPPSNPTPNKLVKL